MCVLIFFVNRVEKFLILRRTERDIIINVYTSLWKVLVILAKFSKKTLKHKMRRKSVQ